MFTVFVRNVTLCLCNLTLESSKSRTFSKRENFNFGYDIKKSRSFIAPQCGIQYLLGVHAPRSVEGLYKSGRLPDKQRIERGTSKHADDRQPHV